MSEVPTILLIDDDEDDRFLFREAIKGIDAGLVCHFYQDAIDAISYLSNTAHQLPDCIFLDLNMPRMNGKECLMEIKSRKELADIPVIILSTSDMESDILNAKMLGASYFITKPHRLKYLSDALRFILKGDRNELPSWLSKWVKII